MYILVELFGTFTRSSATECMLTLKRSGLHNYIYLWVVAITMGFFVLLQWKHFQLLLQQGESGPCDTLMHYLSFANSISAVSLSCLQSQQRTR